MFSYQLLLLLVLITSTYSNNIQHSRQVRNVSLITLTDEVCTEDPDKETVSLQWGRIKDIEPKAFHKCTKMKHLWLDFNFLVVLHSGTFEHNPNLIEISLWKNELEYLDEDVFDGLHELETLNLRCNYLVYFSPRHVQDLLKLKFLNLASNRLINFEINGLLDKMPQLGLFSYNGNDISCSRHAIISAKVNASNIVLGDLHCEDKRHPDLIESTHPQYSPEPYFCMPDDKWDLMSSELIARIDNLKKKYQKT